MLFATPHTVSGILYREVLITYGLVVHLSGTKAAKRPSSSENAIFRLSLNIKTLRGRVSSKMIFNEIAYLNPDEFEKAVPDPVTRVTNPAGILDQSFGRIQTKTHLNKVVVTYSAASNKFENR